ncbi:MAG: transcriptional regulator [Blastocatellia bacterium]|nr:transcriptional regulator [Blastocatellia bacterium]MCS7156485.1 transcriptional regulator [Blastocatellia bacterium]MCX7751774.1 transcriptional regulator [Blastocatellia bacterium]MDW8168876.1 metalloregulator ArsR/SmtB family transcription factor [Acidobacteriota bacterium]MDW8256636.1 metalloregulator ArsR/SmtB family transcription factor [Acidobacteriota bacterium]
MTLELREISEMRTDKWVKDSTRRRILDLLKRRGRATVDEVAAALNITPMGVRRHLSALENANLVRIEIERRPMGRPTYVYKLTEEAEGLFPKGYHQLVLSLLECLMAEGGAERVDELFECRKERLIAAYAPRLEGKTLEERVAEIARIMSENGYMARWQKTEKGYVLTEHNCALYHVARVYPQPCQTELAFLRELLGVEVTRVNHIASGGTCCSYVIHESAPIPLRRRTASSEGERHRQASEARRRRVVSSKAKRRSQ